MTILQTSGPGGWTWEGNFARGSICRTMKLTQNWKASCSSCEVKRLEPAQDGIVVDGSCQDDTLLVRGWQLHLLSRSSSGVDEERASEDRRDSSEEVASALGLNSQAFGTRYSQVSFDAIHRLQLGFSSPHLTLRLLQTTQPVRVLGANFLRRGRPLSPSTRTGMTVMVSSNVVGLGRCGAFTSRQISGQEIAVYTSRPPSYSHKPCLYRSFSQSLADQEHTSHNVPHRAGSGAQSISSTQIVDLVRAEGS
jgi:hypothetical protein